MIFYDQIPFLLVSIKQQRNFFWRTRGLIMIKNTLLTLSFFLIFLQSAWGQVLQYENQKIDQVTITIHENQTTTSDSQAVRSRLRTQKGSFFSQSDFDEDLKTLAKDYDRVEPTIDSTKDTVSITLNIWPKATIRSITWRGNKLIATKTLQKELGINAFTIFDRLAFNQAFNKLKAYYIRKGYFEAKLDYQVIRDSETNEINILIDIEEGRSGKIKDIEFINFAEREESEILKEMVTKEFNRFTSWYTQSGTYNEDAIQQDKLFITNYLQNRGFADAYVEINILETCVNRITIVIKAHKGELYTFGPKIGFEGNHIICDDEIARLFSFRPDQPFSLTEVQDSIQAIVDAYGRLGYVDAVVDYDAELVEGTHTYNTTFKIEEGEQFRVGLIRVFGNVSTKTTVILNESILIPGEIFNTLKLKATEKRLLGIGYFKNVNVYIVKGSESSLLQGNYRDVYIEVEETSTGQFSAFLGYSNVEEIFGGLTVSEHNFNHEGLYYMWRDGLRTLRGGGEYLNLTTQIGQKSRTYGISWTKPHFRDTPWSIGFDLTKSSTRYITKEYDLDSVSLVLRAQRELNAFVRWGVQYRLKNGFVDLHHDADDKGQLQRESRIHGLISAVGTSLSYDTTNDSNRPSSGYKSKLFLEIAGFGGDHSFFNIGYFNSYYLPVGSRLIVKYRADWRFIQPLGDTTFKRIPLDERIFLGGEYNVRGFRPYRLGPRYKESKNQNSHASSGDNKSGDNKKDGSKSDDGHHASKNSSSGKDKHKHRYTDVPRGGLSLQFYSIEMSRRIIQDFEIFTFIDAAHLSKTNWEFGRMSVSIGYGARCKLISSIPPVTFGMGYPLNAHHRNDVKKFFFSFGGNF
jgi:outer membrane protein insertion porin family